MINKKGYRKEWDGELLLNLPALKRGIFTGNYQIDFYGCWHEHIRVDGLRAWIIGEYPE